MRRNPLLMTVLGNPSRGSGLRPKSAKVWCRMCGAWTKDAGPYHIPQVGPQKGNILCDQCYTGWRSGRRMGESWAQNPRRYKANPFILVDSATLKVIRNWKGSMTDRKPWEWAGQAARRLGRNVFVVAHPYVPQGFRAGVEVSPLFFSGGPFQVVFPDGGSRQGSYVDLPPRSNPSIGASLVGGFVGALTTHALSNPGPKEPDMHAAHELELYIDNDSTLYHQQFVPIVKNLMRRRAKGNYDHDKAAKLFLYLADEGARKYYKEFGTSFKFDLPTRWEVAKSLRDKFEVEASYGNYDKMTWGVSKNPLTVSEFMEVNREATNLERQAEEKSSPWVRGYYRGAADGVRGVGRRYVGKAPGSLENPLSRWEAAQMLRTGLSEVQGVDPVDRRDLRHRALSAGRAQGLAAGVMSHGPARAKRAAVKVWERGTKLAYKKNGFSRRRVTMPIEKFAKLVRAQRDPALWRDFVAKCKAYHKWSHGTWPRKVTVERIRKAGVKGMWIAFDMGREPEKTYIMPKGTKRKGAWKHPWDSMPQLRGDAEAGVIITKLSKGNKLTDFLHG